MYEVSSITPKLVEFYSNRHDISAVGEHMHETKNRLTAFVPNCHPKAVCVYNVLINEAIKWLVEHSDMISMKNLIYDPVDMKRDLKTYVLDAHVKAPAIDTQRVVDEIMELVYISAPSQH